MSEQKLSPLGEMNVACTDLLRKVEDVYHAIPDSEIPAAKTCRGVLLGVQLGIKMLRDEMHTRIDRQETQATRLARAGAVDVRNGRA